MPTIKVTHKTGYEIARSSIHPPKGKLFVDHVFSQIIKPMQQTKIRHWNLGVKAYALLAIYSPILGNLFKCKSLPDWEVHSQYEKV
jgi:hypothetical protein